MKRKSEHKLAKMDKDFVKDMKAMGKIRVLKGLADPMKKEEFSLREVTRLLRRTNGYPKSLEELKTKPTKKNG